MAERIIGKSANTVKSMIDKEEKQNIRKMLKNLRFKPFTFTLKIKHNNFRQESKVQAIAYRANQIKYQESNNEIIKRLKIYTTEDNQNLNKDSCGDKINLWRNETSSTANMIF